MLDTLNRLTFIIHTYNRPHFLIRLMRYFDSVAAMRGADIIIADGSSDEDAAPSDEWLAANPVGFDLSVGRHPGSTLMERLGLALESAETPYVILGADDDFYMVDWIETAVSMMDADPELGVVYGQVMLFALAGFSPYGTVVKFDMPLFENPPIPWLEDDAPADRLRELGRNKRGIASPGWYAVHRTDLLKRIIAYGRRFGLEPLMFERFVAITQAASGKMRMIDELALARQVDPHLYRAPFEYRGNLASIAALIDCCAAYLVEQAGFSENDARSLTETALGAEIELMKLADRKRHVRAVAERLPVLRKIWRKLRPVPTLHLTRDARLPAAPDANLFMREQEIVRSALNPEAPNTRTQPNRPHRAG